MAGMSFPFFAIESWICFQVASLLVRRRRVVLGRRWRRRKRPLRSSDLVGQIFQTDDYRLRVDPRGPDDTFQLPDVSRPVVGNQRGHRFGCDAGDAASGCVFVEEMYGQQRNILPPLPERRYSDSENLQPVKQVRA